MDLDLILEAERRGILPDDKKALLAEARSRGLTPPLVSGSGTADDPTDTGMQMTVTPEGGTIEAKKEPGTMEYLWNRAKKGFSGFMGMPGDVTQARAGVSPSPLPGLMPVQAILSALERSRGVGPNPSTDIGAPATSTQYREAFGVDPEMTTSSPGLRYAGGIAEMSGAGGPMMFARGAAAPMLTGTIGSGIGMEAGGDISEGIGLSRQGGEAAGAILGGLPSVAASTVGGAAVGLIRNRFSPAAQRARAAGEVNKEVLGTLESFPPARSNLERSLQVSDEMAKAGAEFTPSLPARTGAPGLLATEKLLVTEKPSALNKAVQNIEKNESEIAKFVNTMFPGGPSGVVTQVAKLQKTAGAKLDQMRQAIDSKLDDVARLFERKPDNHAAGEQVRELLLKQKAAYRGAAGQKYQEVYEAANGAKIRETVDDLVAYTDDVLKSKLNTYQQSEIPSIFRTVRDKFMKDEAKTVTDKYTGRPIRITPEAGGTESTITFEELHSLSKRVNSDLAALRGSQRLDRDFQSLLLNRAKDMIEQKLAKYEGAEYGDVAAKLTEANRFYREEYLPRFKQGFGDDALSRYPTGEYKVPNQMLLDRMTGRNAAQAAKDYKLLFDDVPEAWGALRDRYMDLLWSQKGIINESGKINPKSLDSFLRQHSQTLNEFPQIRNEFQQLRLDNTALLERRGRIVASQEQLSEADMFKLFQNKDPSAVMREAMSSPNVMRLLAHHARGDTGAANALARSVAKQVTESADPVKFLTENRKAIEIGLESLGPDHLKNLETAVEALSINRRSDIPTFVKSSSVAPDAIAEKVGSSPRAIIAHILNVERGRSGPAQEGAAFLGRWFDKLRREHKAATMEAVFYDKDAARAIATLAKNPESKASRINWVNAMAGLGIRAEVAGQE